MPTLRERLADSSVFLLAHKSTESKRNLEIPIHSHARAFYFLNSHVRTRIGLWRDRGEAIASYTSAPIVVRFTGENC
jgi:hypothetical protein